MAKYYYQKISGVNSLLNNSITLTKKDFNPILDFKKNEFKFLAPSVFKFKEKFGSEIFESWLKKIEFIDEFNNYLLLSVSTRFIRDWITSRYLDQILQIIKLFKKEMEIEKRI